MCVGRPCGAYAHGAWLAELLVQIQMLSNDLFGGLVLQSQLFGNPASVVVVDCENVTPHVSTQFETMASGPKAAMTSAH